MGRKLSESIVKRSFKEELKKIVYLKCAEINHYVSGTDSPFEYTQIREVQEFLAEIEKTLGIVDENE